GRRASTRFACDRSLPRIPATLHQQSRDDGGEGMKRHFLRLVTVSMGLLTIGACSYTAFDLASPPSSRRSIFNLSHLDHLGEDVAHDNTRNIRIIHISADAPEYAWTGDDDEGIACVDDAARAGVVYLRHFELTGDESSLEKGKALV